MFDDNPAKWNDDFLNKMRRRGDAPADKVMSAVLAESEIESVNKILVSLIQNDQPIPEDLPANVQAFLTETQDLPEWADADLIKRSDTFFNDYSMGAFSILGCASLPECYSGAIGAKVLGLTGQLEDHIHRRIMETVFMVVYVLCKGGLGPKGKGIRTIQKVRLMHAAIRTLILSNEQAPVRSSGIMSLADILTNTRWDIRTHGLPVNQETMGLTYLSFSFIILRSLEKLGFDISEEEEFAYFHTWNIVGHILGVDDSFFVTNLADGEKLWDMITKRIRAKSDDGQRLTHVLMEYLGQCIKHTSFLGKMMPYRQIPKWLTRELIGKKTANLLGITWTMRDRTNMWVTKSMMTYIGITEAKVYKGLSFAQKLAKWMFRQMAKMPHDRIGRRPAFTIPDQLKEQLDM